MNFSLVSHIRVVERFFGILSQDLTGVAAAGPGAASVTGVTRYS